jgi:DNA-binding MarR family transcriptional regulator
VVLAWLTDEGRGLKRRLLPLLEKLLEDATVGISEKDLQITRQTLTKFQANLGDVLARLNE